MASAPRSSEEVSMFGKRLSENPVVYVQRTEAAESERHNGILIGNIHEETLLIGNFDTIEFSAGEKIVLRMLLGSHLVGFETRVVRKFEPPLIYLVTFPQKIESLNLRKQHRVQAFFPADAQVGSFGASPSDVLLLKTRVLDISSGGCSFRSKSKVQAASEVKITFTLPGDRQIQSVKGTVIDSAKVGALFHNRVKFSLEPANLPIVQEINKWIADSLSFTAEDE